MSRAPDSRGRFLEIAEERPVFEPGAVLAGRYRLARLVARGAIGEVYEAFDEELRERVALKTLRSELAHETRALERFKREVQLARRVTHANACRIFDLGVHREGETVVPFLTMEFLEGESLAERLARPPALTSAAASRHARQIAAALAAVHAADLVHRDLKPANVMLVPDGDGSRAVVTDFGLVRSGAADAAGTSGLYGTPGYMAPEQRRGEPVTPRSDVYSFGVVFSEMLTGGEHPVLARCLAPDPDDRFASGAELHKALTPWAPRKIATWAALAVAVVGVLASFGVARRPPARAPAPAPAAPAVKRIVVLPFENAGAAEDDYLADGIADELRGRLTALSDLQVIARGSSIAFKTTTKTPAQIAQELRVRYLLTATVRSDRTGNTGRVRVSPELVEMSGSGAPIVRWQQPFDAPLEDVLKLESGMAEQVARALGLALQAVDLAKLDDAPTRNPAAYQAFLRGEALLNAGFMMNLKQAVPAYEDAVALDPSFADAWARLAQVNVAESNVDPTFAEEARVALERARAAGPDRPLTFLAAQVYLTFVKDDPEGALAEAAAGLRRHPDDARLLQLVGSLERALGRNETAVVNLERAQEVDPLQPSLDLAIAYMELGRWRDASAVMDRDRARHPQNLERIRTAALLHVYQGDLDGARAVLRSLPMDVDHTQVIIVMAVLDENGWVLDDADRDRLLHLGPAAWDFAFSSVDEARPFALMQLHLLKGDLASARVWAQRALPVFEARAQKPLNPGARRVVLPGLAYITACLGHREEALRYAKRAEALADAGKSPYDRAYVLKVLARAYTLLGDHERAIDLLTKAPHVVDGGGISPATLRIDPNYAALRGNPRFEQLASARWP